MAELPGGWKLDDLAGMARHVAHTQPALMIELEEARDIAACALVERIYTDPPPDRDDLFHAARRALARANTREISYIGLYTQVARSGREGTSHEFARYWRGRGALVSPFEETVVERLAARQVFEGLRPRAQETLAALAKTGSYEAARDLLGLSARTWWSRIYAARLEARALWHWPEPPSKQWMTDRPGITRDPKAPNGGLLHIRKRHRALRNKPASPPLTDTATSVRPKENSMTTTTVIADPPRKRRCRMHNGKADPCPNEAISDDPKVPAICPSHALRAAQLLAEHGVIEMILKPVPTRTVRRRAS